MSRVLVLRRWSTWSVPAEGLEEEVDQTVVEVMEKREEEGSGQQSV